MCPEPTSTKTVSTSPYRSRSAVGQQSCPPTLPVTGSPGRCTAGHRNLRRCCPGFGLPSTGRASGTGAPTYGGLHHPVPLSRRQLQRRLGSAGQRRRRRRPRLPRGLRALLWDLDRNRHLHQPGPGWRLPAPPTGRFPARALTGLLLQGRRRGGLVALLYDLRRG